MDKGETIVVILLVTFCGFLPLFLALMVDDLFRTEVKHPYDTDMPDHW